MAAYQALTIELAEGLITFELYWQYCSRTCENLVAAVEEGGWVGTSLTRRGLVLTAVTKDGAVGPIISDPPPSELSHSGAGLLTCPVSEDGSWFITLAPVPALDPHSVIVGRVVSGMGVLLRAASGNPEIKAMRIEQLPHKPRPTNKGFVN
eukprot:GILI01040316.1.p1 GENE.GILI01040316.1~~GILI01040316.1.p1  ORF type:complete len:151 (-),score=4.87 GILI01040316.1:32-484(-)